MRLEKCTKRVLQIHTNDGRLWQGFDHGEDKSEFEKEEIVNPRPRKHFNRDLCVAACNNEGELVSICGLWYNPKTDYVYSLVDRQMDMITAGMSDASVTAKLPKEIKEYIKWFCERMEVQ